ncbi:MAG: hypothetical protein IKZ14_07875 [Muribaculaceae bacterium]|nr:hypothetical protein [Muribaculaceae bacterium]
MKKILLALCALMVSFNIFAVRLESGSLAELAKAGRANFEIDYSAASIHGMTETDFAEYEQDWHKDQPQIVMKFISCFASVANGKVILTKNGNNALTLRWVVLQILPNGTTLGELHLIGENGEVLARIVELEGKGGIFGTKLNLIKDGAKRSGQNAGIFLRNEIKKLQ